MAAAECLFFEAAAGGAAFEEARGAEARTSDDLEVW